MLRKADIHFSQDFLRVLILVCNLILRFHHGSTELRRESLGDLHRLTDTSTLDDNILDFVLLGQLGQLREKVTTQGTANAAILQLNQLLFFLGDLVVLDQSRIDVKPELISTKRWVVGSTGILTGSCHSR